MAGQALSVISQFAQITGKAYVSGPDHIPNDAAMRNYSTLTYALRGKDMSEVIRGGESINEVVKLSARRTTSTYLPFEEGDAPHHGTTVALSAPWRFFRTPITFSREFMDLNMGSDQRGSVRSLKIKSYVKSKYQDAYTDMLGWLEQDALWQVPDKSKMEAAGGTEMYSIPVFVNEYSNGLPSSIHPGGAWTTIHGVDPTATGQTEYKPYQGTYGASNEGFTVNSANNVIEKLDRAIMATDFRSPPIQKEYFDADRGEGVSIIGCSLDGRAKVMSLFRRSQDRWDNMWDPYGNPVYKGIPLVYIRALDTAALYPTGSGGVLSTEDDTDGTTNAGPRFWGLQFKDLKMFFHNEKYFFMDEALRTPSQPNVTTSWITTYANMFCTSRRKQFILYPNADN